MENECNEPRTRKDEKELERYHTPRSEEHRSGLGICRTLYLDREAWHECVALVCMNVVDFV